MTLLKNSNHSPKKAIGVFGQIDILVNNAGWLLGGAIEEITPEEVKAQFDTNFFGVINVTNAFLPHLRSRKTGTIVNISSIGSYLALNGAESMLQVKQLLNASRTLGRKSLLHST